jgi:heptaprenyl diphosphate synthase
MNDRIKKLIFLSEMLALAIVLSIIESLIPIPLPIPAKIGLANIVTLVVIYLYSPKEGALIALSRVILVTVLTGKYSLFLMSFFGMVISTFVMIILNKFTKINIVVVSAIASIAHAVGQICGAIIMLGTTGVVAYLPIMLLFSLPAGILTGIIANRSLFIITKHRNNIKTDDND